MITHTDINEKILLPDSSWVILNAQSQLSYSATWKSNQYREVWLKGEGFFDIKKSPQSGRELIVHTDDLSIRVLGTRFNVNSRSDKTDVVLKERNIQLNQLNFPAITHSEIVMKPGEMVSYSRKTIFQ